MDIAYIPSPSTGVLELGPVPLRGYAFCILAGLFTALWIVDRRWVARGGKKGTTWDIAVWAVPFGLAGGRLYHVITDYQLYFGEGRDWVDAFKIWEGGLGIWGAVAMGALGAWIGCRRRGIALPPYADAVAPGLAIAQAIGRWGNWFNQELYGRPTDLPWGLRIDPAYRPDATPELATYHPTFLYESLWCLGVAALVFWADRRFRLGHGRAFALYVAAYTAGRGWIEYMRVDEAHHILGLRLNLWTSILVFTAAVVYMIVSARLRPGRESVVEPEPPSSAKAGSEGRKGGKPDAEGTADTDPATAADGDGAAGSGEAKPSDGAADGKPSGGAADRTAEAPGTTADTAASDAGGE
ncbi:prolipoprotein diacylglyceryl transferase [Streptomyces sp. C10-9-1]|uniref:prolipoprotein diacylglyceryl transferase n=1 Tax=Streptomyces sp. C10-9-1 TaxID=1859285 RepID=UPI003F4A088E